MRQAISALLTVMLTVLGVASLPAEMASGGVLGVVAVLLAVAVVVAIVAQVTAPPGTRSAPHPRRAIDVSTLLTQSDPDAAGHPRPRAPGVASAV